ncbi:MAG: hypothetical protein GQ574_23540 [Crocinitomix sp.]|nr:hypothetical protein [Crocinitomix sp.]
MIKKIKLISTLSFAALLLAGVTACNKNGEKLNSDLSIEFQTQVGASNYAINDVYRNASDVDIKFESFQFYLSDITIVNSDGEGRLVSEIELFKFDATGHSSLDFRVPNGDYESIQFGIGVKKELNEADPSTYSEAGHPLNTIENTYWGWAGMYRFIMNEGRFDADLDGDFEGIFAYHTGRELSYRTMTIAHDFEISKKEANALNFTIDLYQLLEKPGNEVDVTTEPFYHGSTEDEDISIRISDNMTGAIAITP